MKNSTATAKNSKATAAKSTASKSKSTTASKKTATASKTTIKPKASAADGLRELFEDSLKDIYLSLIHL